MLESCYEDIELWNRLGRLNDAIPVSSGACPEPSVSSSCSLLPALFVSNVVGDVFR